MQANPPPKGVRLESFVFKKKSQHAGPWHARVGGDLPLRVACAPFLVHFQWLIQARATDLNRDFHLAPFSVASLSRRKGRKGKTARTRARGKGRGALVIYLDGFNSDDD